MKASVQIYARITGLLFFLTIPAGFFGEVYVPAKIIVGGNAAATAHNVLALQSLFRFGFAAYLVEAFCDIGLTLLLYVLLRPVQKDVALLAAFFGLISTALYAVAELFYFGASIILTGAGALQGFSPDQVNALALLSLRMFARGGGIFMAFYGIATLLRGYLIWRSRYLPKFLGVLLLLAGAGFIAKNVTLVLAPAYASDLLVLPMFLVAVAMTVWFLVKGVDVSKWPEAVRS
jgi:hypothetical protein